MRNPLTIARLRLAVIAVGVCCLPHLGWSWGWGHKFINMWAIERLPEWQKAYFGQENLDKLPVDYKSIQDAYTGSKSPVWAPYCNPPVRASLHDPGGPEAGTVNMAWYLEQIRDKMRAGEPDEAMKYLGVLCHWNEDPGSPSAHSRYLTEPFLQTVIPSPDELLGRSYSFGYKGIHMMDAASEAALHKDEVYTPKLLGADPAEAAARIYQGQRRLALRSAQCAVKTLVYYTNGDTEKAVAAVRDQATYNARFVTDIMYTAGCIASGRFDEDEIEALEGEPLYTWLPDPVFVNENRLYPQPYYARPWMVDHAYDAKRNVLPLAFAGEGDGSKVEHGFGTTVTCNLDFNVAPGSVFGYLTVRVGLHAAAAPEGKAAFVILIDGEEAVRTEPMAGGQPPRDLRVDLPDRPVVKLTLRAEAVEGGEALQSLPVWGDPTLWRRTPIRAASLQPATTLPLP